MSELLELSGVGVAFTRPGLKRFTQAGAVRAVDQVDLSIRPGEVLGIVGESGCGKSTLARVALGLIEPTEGSVRFEGTDLAKAKSKQIRGIRRNMQLVHQDPYSSFDPRRTLGYSIMEPLEVHRIGKSGERRSLVQAMVTAVGLDARHLDVYPHQLSGGQLQRASLARAYVLRPKFLVLDEATASLDVSIRAQVIKLLGQMQEDFGTSFLFISHDMGSIHSLSDRVAVMYFGRIVELAQYDDVFHAPMHPYTKALISAVPKIARKERGQRGRIILSGEPPRPGMRFSGCPFASRCPLRKSLGNPERCVTELPLLRPHANHRQVACHFADGGPDKVHEGSAGRHPPAAVGGGANKS